MQLKVILNALVHASLQGRTWGIVWPILIAASSAPSSCHTQGMSVRKERIEEHPNVMGHCMVKKRALVVSRGATWCCTAKGTDHQP